jgi:hypothetical protein
MDAWGNMTETVDAVELGLCLASKSQVSLR